MMESDRPVAVVQGRERRASILLKMTDGSMLHRSREDLASLVCFSVILLLSNIVEYPYGRLSRSFLDVLSS